MADRRGRSGPHLRYANMLMAILELIFSMPEKVPEKTSLHGPTNKETKKCRQTFRGNQLKLGPNNASKRLQI